MTKFKIFEFLDSEFQILNSRNWPGVGKSWQWWTRVGYKQGVYKSWWFWTRAGYRQGVGKSLVMLDKNRSMVAKMSTDDYRRLLEKMTEKKMTARDGQRRTPFKRMTASEAFEFRAFFCFSKELVIFRSSRMLFTRKVSSSVDSTEFHLQWRFSKILQLLVQSVQFPSS